MKRLFKRMVAIMLTGSILLPVLTACGNTQPNTPNDNGEDEEPMDTYHIKLQEKELIADTAVNYDNIYFQKPNSALQGNISTTYTYEDEDASLKWIASSGLSIQTPEIADWSSYNTLKFAIYSEKATNTSVQIRFNNPRTSAETNMAPYYRYPILINFTGWKFFELKLSEMISTTTIHCQLSIVN